MHGTWKLLAAVAGLLLAGCSSDSDIKDLGSSDNLLRQKAVRQLVLKRSDPAAVSKVVKALQSKDPRTVLSAIEVLGSMKDQANIGALSGMAESPDPLYRAATMRALMNIGGDEAILILARALADTSADVRREALMSLGDLHPMAQLGTVYKAVKDPKPAVRAAAVYALYQYAGVREAGIRASDFQTAVQDSFDRVRYVAVQALGRAYPDSADGEALLLDALEDQNDQVKIEAITSLAKLKCGKAVPVLKKMHDYAPLEVQKAITGAIKTISGEDFPKLK
jgi:HEAT repeat protein